MRLVFLISKNLLAFLAASASLQKFFKPPYVGGRGWICLVLNRVSHEELNFLLRQAWRLIAPKRLQTAVQQL